MNVETNTARQRVPEEVTEFVRPAQVWRELGISPATGWRRVKEKLLPAPVHIGPNTTVFIRAELERVKAALINSSRSGIRAA